MPIVFTTAAMTANAAIHTNVVETEITAE